MKTKQANVNRRAFLRMTGGLCASSAWAGLSRADDRPPVRNPRATSGDSVAEPDWQERLTITVGPAKAQLVGNDIGIFFCWGVKFGLAEKNFIDRTRRYGISIGHCDTDNQLADNKIDGFSVPVSDLR